MGRMVVIHMLCMEHVGFYFAVVALAVPLIGGLAYEAYLGFRQEDGEGTP